MILCWGTNLFTPISWKDKAKHTLSLSNYLSKAIRQGRSLRKGMKATAANDTTLAKEADATE
jgi:hypothetical protein